MNLYKINHRRFLMGSWNYFGPIIFSGLTHWWNCSSVSSPSSTAESFRLRPFLCACFAIVAALSYPICSFKAVTSINDLLRSSSILLRSGSMPRMQFLVKETEASERSRTDWRMFRRIIGLKTFSSKCPLHPPMLTATLFPMTWAATIVTASHCVGLTFPVTKQLHVVVHHI